MPICATRILTDEEIHEKVMKALAIEKKRELKRLGREFEERSRVGVVDNVCSDNGMPVAAMEAIVMLNKTSATNSLSKAEWDSIDAAMPAEEAKTHKNLSAWITDRAKASGITADDDEEEDDDPEMDALLQDGSLATGEEGGDDGDDEPEKKDEKKDDKEEEFVPVEKAKNWSSINTVAKESKLSFRGSFTPISFTNWLWYRCVRPKLEDTKSKLPELEDEELFGQYHVDDVDDVLLEFMPPAALKKSDDKKDKKDKKDDKKDKKDDGKKDKKDDGKKSKDDGKKDDGKKADKKKKKDIVQLNAKEKLQAQNLIRHMVYGESEKKRTTVEGWVNLLEEKEMPTKCPWEFQIAHVMRSCMAMEYASKKKKDDSVDKFQYYEMAQALADAISMLKRQYKVEFPDQDVEAVLLPLRDALDLQRRFREGSVPGINFDILWYLQNGASLLAGSSFTKKHRTTIFQPFEIQQKMVDAILQKGPQLVFGIAPPGTGKTAIVSHLAALFPAHHLVFCCAALPVVLGVGRVLKSRGVPFAFAKGRRITPSYSCGKNLGTHVDLPASEGSKGMSAVASLGYTVMKMNLERKQKRLAEKKKKRNLHDLKRFPRMFLMCDTASCAWLLRQLDPHRTILVVDEPPMGSDSYPETPESNPLACAMIQAMMTPAYKTIWMSATLPRVEALPTLVNCFLSRFQLSESDRDKHVRECFSIQLDRGALLCGPSGSVAFPHQRCTTADELERLCKRLPTDPLVLKAYTERALASLVQRWQTLDSQGKVPPSFKKRMPDLGAKFADLSNLNHTSIREYAMELLQAVAAEGDDDFTLAFCQKDEAEKNVFPAFSLEEMLFSNAYAFPGLTLVADDDPKGQMELMSKRLQAHMPKASDIEEDLKSQEVSAAKAAKFADDDEKARMEEHQAKLKFSPELVIQSEQFLKRWCPNYKAEAGGARITRLLPTVQEFKKIKELPVTEQWQMLALSGAGSFDPLLDADVHDPVYTQWVHESMTMNKLACVTAGKEFTWGANVPASTVVVTKSFAETTSVAGMLQYVGRAARRGLTTHGQAIFERDEDLERIFANPDGLSTEALTMERYAKWWLSRGSEW